MKANTAIPIIDGPTQAAVEGLLANEEAVEAIRFDLMEEVMGELPHGNEPTWFSPGRPRSGRLRSPAR